MTQRHPPIQSIEDVIVFKLARFVGINERLGQRWSEALFDLSLKEWRMLALVQKRGPVRAGDLAELMLMDKSQLSRLVKSLSAKQLVATITDDELLNLDTQTLLYRLFHEDGARMLESIPVKFHCHCSAERVASALISIGETEVRTIIEEDGKIATGQSADTDTVVASVRAYISALNRLLIRRDKGGSDKAEVSYKDVS